MGNNSYIVIDAGGTYHKSAVVDSNGKVYEGSGYKIKSFSDGTKHKVTDGNIEAYDIGKWADEGDSASIAAYSEVGRILSENLSEILREEGIQCLLFGGQISRSFNHMEDELIRGLKDVQCLEKIAMAKSIDNAALYGAFKAIPQ